MDAHPGPVAPATALAAGRYTAQAQQSNSSTGLTGLSSASTFTISTVPAQVDLCGTITSNRTLDPSAAIAYVLTCPVTVQPGATLTIAPATVIKGESGSGLQVDGSLVVNGTAASPVTFTSIDDNSVGGSTGSGSPSPGDWGRIDVTPTGAINLAFTHVSYASTALNSDTDGDVTVSSSQFAQNTTALDIQATVGTNAAIHGNWFDGNGTALDGSSDWDPGDASPFFPCQYIPTMSATNNMYGPSRISTPFLSPSANTELTVALIASGGEEWPDGWNGDIKVGQTDATTTDTITWTELPCTDGTLEGTTVEPATPFAIG